MSDLRQEGEEGAGVSAAIPQTAGDLMKKKLGTPFMFGAEGGGTRHRQYAAEGGARALSRSFAPDTQPSRPSSNLPAPVGEVRGPGV